MKRGKWTASGEVEDSGAAARLDTATSTCYDVGMQGVYRPLAVIDRMKRTPFCGTCCYFRQDPAAAEVAAAAARNFPAVGYADRTARPSDAGSCNCNWSPVVVFTTSSGCGRWQGKPVFASMLQTYKLSLPAEFQRVEAELRLGDSRNSSEPATEPSTDLIDGLRFHNIERSNE